MANVDCNAGASGERRAVWALLTGVAIVGSNSLLLSPILTSVAGSLNGSVVEVSRAGAAYGGATAISALAFSKSIDRLGTRQVLIVGFCVLAFALLVSAAAMQWQALAGAQGLAGLAAGLILPATYSHAIASAPEGRGAATLGKVLNGWAISLVAGVPLSALVAGAFGWRISYVLLALASAGVAAIVWRFGHSAAPVQSSDGRLLRALRTRNVPRLLTICFLFMTAFYGQYAFFGDHLRGGLGASTGLAGVAVLAYGLGFGVAGRADHVVDRLGPQRILAFCLCALALVYGMMFLAYNSIPALLAISVIWGFANHLGLNILFLMLGEANPARRGAIMSVNSAVSCAGTLCGITLFGEIYKTGDFERLSLAAAAIMLTGVGLALLAARRQRSSIARADISLH